MEDNKMNPNDSKEVKHYKCIMYFKKKGWNYYHKLNILLNENTSETHLKLEFCV